MGRHSVYFCAVADPRSAPADVRLPLVGQRFTVFALGRCCYHGYRYVEFFFGSGAARRHFDCPLSSFSAVDADADMGLCCSHFRVYDAHVGLVDADHPPLSDSYRTVLVVAAITVALEEGHCRCDELDQLSESGGYGTRSQQLRGFVASETPSRLLAIVCSD